jgi:hypothetical protein
MATNVLTHQGNKSSTIGFWQFANSNLATVADVNDKEFVI